MTKAFKRLLLIAGAVFFMFAWVLFSGNQFVVNVGGNKKIITRQGEPVAYRSAEVVSVLVGVIFFAAGIYFLRRKP